MSYLLSPINRLSQVNRELSRFFGDHYPGEAALLDEGGWTPSVDITESETAFKVVADVPGVEPKDIEISLHHGLLTIRGERDATEEVKEGSYTRRERVRGSFVRQFNLPDTADEDTIKAKSVQGVLEITIPKAKKSLPKTIKVEGE